MGLLSNVINTFNRYNKYQSSHHTEKHHTNMVIHNTQNVWKKKETEEFKLSQKKRIYIDSSDNKKKEKILKYNK